MLTASLIVHTITTARPRRTNTAIEAEHARHHHPTADTTAAIEAEVQAAGHPRGEDGHLAGAEEEELVRGRQDQLQKTTPWLQHAIHNTKTAFDLGRGTCILARAHAEEHRQGGQVEIGRITAAETRLTEVAGVTPQSHHHRHEPTAPSAVVNAI